MINPDAEDFETIARRHAALPESRQSFGARLAAFARFMVVPDPTGDRSRDLRPGARATCAADAASRARRLRLEGEPRLRGLSYGGQYAEGRTRVIDTWSIALSRWHLRLRYRRGPFAVVCRRSTAARAKIRFERPWSATRSVRSWLCLFLTAASTWCGSSMPSRIFQTESEFTVSTGGC